MYFLWYNYRTLVPNSSITSEKQVNFIELGTNITRSVMQKRSFWRQVRIHFGRSRWVVGVAPYALI